MLGVFARVLDVDEDRLAVRRFAEAGEFAARRTDQEALERVRRRLLTDHGVDRVLRAVRALVGQGLLGAVANLARQRGQHHAVGHVGVGAVVGLDPADAGRAAEHQAVGAGEVLVGGQLREIDRVGIGSRLSAEGVDVPTEAGARRIAAVIGHAQDVAVRIPGLRLGALHVGVDARIGRIGSQLRRRGRFDAPIAVIGQREVDLAVGRVGGAPFGAVHLGGARSIGSEARIDHHVGQVRKRIAGKARHRRIRQRQLQPGACAVGIEARHVERALVQVLGAGGKGIHRIGIGIGPDRI
ncbi:hypothetical protein D9M72_361630 [compost metagenome]